MKHFYLQKVKELFISLCIVTVLIVGRNGYAATYSGGQVLTTREQMIVASPLILPSPPTNTVTVEIQTRSPWDEEAVNERINRYRKRDMEIIVTDKLNKRIQNAKVEILQTKNHYPFGSAIQWNAMSFPQYTEFFKKHFNCATPEYEGSWAIMEYEQGRENYHDADRICEFCQVNDIKMRGGFFWAKEEFEPLWIQNLDDAGLKAAMENRMTTVANHFKGKFVHWVVNNEAIHGSFYKDRFENSLLFENSVRVWMYERAHELDPEVPLFTNDYSIISVGETESYKTHIQGLIYEGAPIDGIGVQCHFVNQTLNPAIIYDRFESMSKLNLPIWVTEFDWNDPDENARADKLESFYRVAFSHPSVEGIMMWGFWGPVHWRGSDCCIVNADWTLNEAGRRYEKLREEWRTKDSGLTDYEGKVAFRGFHGIYQVTITLPSGYSEVHEVDLKKGPTEVEVFNLRLRMESTSRTVSPGESIQQAINDADDGNVIIVSPGTYYENINFLGKAITLKSIDPNNSDIVESTIIDGQKRGRVVSFENGEEPTSILSGFTLMNGEADYGGGIGVKLSSPTVCSCIIRDNKANQAGGGGVYSYFCSSPLLINCTIMNNTSTFGGGIRCQGHTPTKGIRGSGYSPTIRNCTITYNTANESGGGICLNECSPRIINCTIEHNKSGTIGGGILCYQAYPLIKDCTILQNESKDSGGGIYYSEVDPSILNVGDPGELELSNCRIENNSTGLSGGGIVCYKSSLTIANCTIKDNKLNLTAPGGGAGICCFDSSSPLIRDCTIQGNKIASTDNYGGGGGIVVFTNSNPTITGCVITRNDAPDDGGGLWVGFHSEVKAVNSIISFNKSLVGGGIYISDPNSSLTISNCTITENTAQSQAGGIYCDKASLNVINSILWFNSPIYTEILMNSGGTPDVRYSNIQYRSPLTYPGQRNINVDPLFVDRNNEDYHLQTGSNCIDAGTGDNAPYQDKEGETRPLGLGYDMGAYEFRLLPCTYAIFPTSESFSDAGGNGNIQVITANDCSWKSISNCSWISIDSGDSGAGNRTGNGTGNGTVSFAVAANNGLARTGTISITGTAGTSAKTYTVIQDGKSDSLWKPIEGQQDNMIITGPAYVGQGRAMASDLIGAFGQGGVADCRAVAKIDEHGEYYLTLLGNTAGERITFKIMRSDNGQILDSLEDISFAPDTIQDKTLHFNFYTPQEITLVTGWNWVSFRVLPDDTSLEAIFGESIDLVEEIKTQTRSTSYRPGRGWVGEDDLMSDIAKGVMFKIKTKEGFTVKVNGKSLDLGLPITLNEGWTWLAYLPPSCASVEGVIASVKDDLSVIKSQTKSKINKSGMLRGDLDEMCPGKGYIVKMDEERIFTYNHEEK